MSLLKKNKRTHWTSLEEKRGELQPADYEERQLPALESNRRDFLKIMGFSLAAASLSACTRSPVYKAVTYLNKPVEVTPGVANYYATTCAGCTAGCSLLVKVRDGRPIKVEGNPESPLNAGKTCAVGQASLLSLYDETRLRDPYWAGQKTSWEDLDQRVRAKLFDNKDTSGKVVVLSGTLLSPASRALIKDFLEKFPDSKHVTYDPISYQAIRTANKISFGQEQIPTYKIDQASSIVSVNADFLGAWLSPVEFTRQYAVRRKPSGKKAMSRHIHFESTVSVTGSNADQRIAIDAQEEGLVVHGLLYYVAQAAGRSVSVAQPKKLANKTDLKKIARELWKDRGHSLVLSGSSDVATQKGINAINALLGNIGKTIDLDMPSYQAQGNQGDLAWLSDEMQAGRVRALFVYQANPVYNSAHGEKFKKALDKVPLSLSFSLYNDETAQHVDAIAPDLHFLESWNDAQPQESLFHLTQPTIAPLFNTRSAQDSLLAWMGDQRAYYHYLRDHWKANLLHRQSRYLGFESFWNHSLHDGVLKLSQNTVRQHRLQESLVDTSFDLSKRDPSPYSLQLALYESVALRNGDLANNPWLQELPDPISKISWENYASISPRQAKALALEEGDIVQVKSGSLSAHLPVHVQPGQAANTVAAALGYGRSKSGPVGNGVGANLYPFLNGTTEISLSKTGRKTDLAAMQTHFDMMGRPIIRETSLPVYKEDHHAGNKDHVPKGSLWPEHHQVGPRWGMVIDLNLCTGCESCVISCQVENNVPVVGKDEVQRRREMHWIRIDRYYNGSEDDPEMAHQPMMCQHCSNAPCETVCPVLATVHSSDGLNQQVYNRCVGTRYCANNCPYKVRRFNWFDYADNDKFDYNMNNGLAKMVLNPDVVVRSRGVMEKCSMCIQRIQEGKLDAKKEGKALEEGAIKTACQQACPADAIVFGDLNNPNSRVSKLVKDPRYYRVLEELNVQPGVGYLTKVRNREDA